MDHIFFRGPRLRLIFFFYFFLLFRTQQYVIWSLAHRDNNIFRDVYAKLSFMVLGYSVATKDILIKSNWRAGKEPKTSPYMYRYRINGMFPVPNKPYGFCGPCLRHVQSQNVYCGSCSFDLLQEDEKFNLGRSFFKAWNCFGESLDYTLHPLFHIFILQNTGEKKKILKKKKKRKKKQCLCPVHVVSMATRACSRAVWALAPTGGPGAAPVLGEAGGDVLRVGRGAGPLPAALQAATVSNGAGLARRLHRLFLSFTHSHTHTHARTHARTEGERLSRETDFERGRYVRRWNGENWNCNPRVLSQPAIAVERIKIRVLHLSPQSRILDPGRSRRKL